MPDVALRRHAAPLSFVVAAEIESLPSPQHRLGLGGIAAVSLVQDDAGQETQSGTAPLLGLHDDAGGGLAPLGEQRKHSDVAEATREQG